MYHVKNNYLIGQNLGGRKFLRTKFFGVQNFRHQLEISAVRVLLFLFLFQQKENGSINGILHGLIVTWYSTWIDRYVVFYMD